MKLERWAVQPQRAWAALLLWVVLLWGIGYQQRDFWEPDEARFVYIAREMRAANSWLIPSRHGVVYGDKPPLMFWLINLGETTIGQLSTNFGARLPSLLGVWLSLLALFNIAKLWYTPRVGWRAVVILSSSWMFWKVNGMGQIDPLLTGLELQALYLLLYHSRTRAGWSCRLAFLLMGLAVIAKGPVGFLIPLGSWIALTLAGGEALPLRPRQWCTGLLLVLAVPALWLAGAALSAAGSDYLHEVLFIQNISRAAGDLGHRRPFWYYLLHAPLGFIPWTLFLPPALLWLRRKETARYRALLGWFLYVIIFFSLPVSKRNLYIMSAFAAPALALAAAWEEVAASRLCRHLAVTLLWLATTTGLLLALLLLVIHLPALDHWDLTVEYWQFDLPAWPFFATAIVPALALRTIRRYPERWLPAFALGLSLAFALLGATIYPTFNRFKAPHELEPLAASYIPADGRLLLYDMRGEIQALYAGRRGWRCDSDEELQQAMEVTGRGIAVFEARHAQNLSLRFPATIAAGRFRMGTKTIHWLAYDTTGMQSINQ